MMAARPKEVQMKFLSALVAVVLVVACAHQEAAEKATVQRMYVLNCGEAVVPDVSRWSPGVDVGQSREFSDNCYLIRHAKGWMLWDSGYPDSLAATPEGVVSPATGARAKLPKTLVSQLAEIGVKPTEIHYVAFSHSHGDHIGNANLFTSATLYIQEPEYEAAFGPTPQKFGFNPASYDKLRANPIVKLKGDFDVFGDGSVTILSTPGHTPGHQSLMVRMQKTGVVILSGDMVHFQSNWENRRVPGFNFNRDQSVASMNRVAAIMVTEKAQLWINHDKAQTAKMPRPPAYLD
jgi:glyoxylase-like metal-dependent hydrolase (beta-lactamase superfamily II)